MKKMFLALLMCLFAVNFALASPDNKTIIAETQLDNSPTSVTSSTFNIQDYHEAGFWVKYDETEVGGGLSVAVTLDVSYDDTTWLDMSFYDLAGGTTLQTSETISSDGWYYCSLPSLYFQPGSILYIRMVIIATGSDVDDIALVTAYMIGTK